MSQQLWHCQICGRAIKAKNGLIAHHGYSRPGTGWQTRSCFGARRVPFEVGHDALDEFKALIDDHYLPDALARRVKFIAEPPETIKETRYLGAPERTYERPTDFDPAKHADAGSHRANCYEGAFTSRCWQMKAEIKGWRDELEFVTKRRAEWKEPA